MGRPAIYRPAKIKATRAAIAIEGIDNYIEARWAATLEALSADIVRNPDAWIDKEVMQMRD